MGLRRGVYMALCKQTQQLGRFMLAHTAALQGAVHSLPRGAARKPHAPVHTSTKQLSTGCMSTCGMHRADSDPHAVYSAFRTSRNANAAAALQAQ
jgi:hypothetical protein